MPLLDVTLTVSTEERPDRWAAFVHELGFFAYGKTEKEASDRVEHILSALAESFAGDAAGFSAYLDEHEVKYVQLDDPDIPPGPISTTTAYRGSIFPPARTDRTRVPRLRTFGEVEVPSGVTA